MGLIGNILGFQGKGKIDVVVDRPYYVSGELVKGKILVDVISPIQCNEVVLLASGKEKVEWKDGGKTHSGLVEFFKKKIVLFCVEVMLQPGTYEYPFEYQLPEALPGSFDAKRSGIVAKIEYSMTGTVIVDGVFARDLMKKTILTLFAHHVSTILTPSVDSTSQQVTFLWCFDHGRAAFKATIDKVRYDPTETPHVHCDVQNGSRANVRGLKCVLVRTESLSSDGATKTFYTELCVATFGGVPAHAVLSETFPFALTTKDLVPSTRGSFLDVGYVVRVHGDLPNAPPVVLSLPIEIAPPTLVLSAATSSTKAKVVVMPTDGTTTRPPIVMATDGTTGNVDEPPSTSTPRGGRRLSVVGQKPLVVASPEAASDPMPLQPPTPTQQAQQQLILQNYIQNQMLTNPPVTMYASPTTRGQPAPQPMTYPQPSSPIMPMPYQTSYQQPPMMVYQPPMVVMQNQTQMMMPAYQQPPMMMTMQNQPQTMMTMPGMVQPMVEIVYDPSRGIYDPRRADGLMY
ncbi:Aste57867_15134 [Aphanomyces stellatus]|uniref:Aste57867_15134 protein n=1 Tax=Aphanomyces stellatus TaxID=120398 RepID=A0A485L491_9STRA|nr:hypothetical protein As57867_015078 [Aphanomyces stellatus]VFT91944.1 Aste57867_15134 [Aphanomyces stellatus]